MCALVKAVQVLFGCGDKLIDLVGNHVDAYPSVYQYVADKIPQVKTQLLSVLSKLLEALLFHVHGEGSSMKGEVLLPFPGCRMKTEWSISMISNNNIFSANKYYLLF